MSVFLRKVKQKEFIGIVIKKEKTTKKTNNEAILATHKMKYGLFEDNSSLGAVRYLITFITKRGEYTFKVSKGTYYSIKIDSLCRVKYNGKTLDSLEFIKIAKKEDIIKYGFK